MPNYATNLITGTTAAAALTGAQPLRRPPVNSMQVGDVQHDSGILIFASGVNLVINDVIELGILPADHVLTDWVLLNDDFDSATSLTVRIGLMTGLPGDAGRALATIGSELLAVSTVMQAPAVTRGSVVAAIAGIRALMVPSAVDRSIGMGVIAAPTNPATIRQLDFNFHYRASRYGG